MTKQATSPVLKLIRRMAEEQRDKKLSDQELLIRFRTQDDEAAFRGLVQRHGSMVLDVCRNVLGNEADAEDAFQATFLVLTRKAAAIRKERSVGSWLYGVAYRIARNAQTNSAKRRKHEQYSSRERPMAASEDHSWREVQQALHAELNSVSECYRAPLVLCYLEGKTQDAAATLLGVSKATVKKRLERGRALLRLRLVRRGLGPAAVLAVAAWPPAGVAAQLPSLLVSSTIKAATLVAAGQAAAGVVSAEVTALTEGVMKAMFTSKLKSVIFAALLGAVLVGGAGLVARPMLHANPQQNAVPKQAAAVKKPGTSLAGPGKSPRAPKVVGTNGSVDAIAWNPTGKLLAVNLRAWDRSGYVLQLRDSQTGAVVKTLIESKTPVSSVAFTDGGKSVAAAIGRIDGDRHDDIVRIWDIATGKEKAVLKGPECGIFTIVCSADGKLLAGAGPAGNDEKGITSAAAVCLWSLASGKLLWRAGGHTSEIYGLSFSPDGKILASGSRDKTIRFWDVEKGTCTRTLEGHGEHGVYSVAFSPKDAKLLASGGLDGTVRLWNAETGKLKDILTKTYVPAQMVVVAFAPDGKTLASAGDTGFENSKGNFKRQGDVKLWDLQTGKLNRVLTKEVEAIYALAFSSDGSTLAVGCWDKKLVLLPTGQ
jgi:RNA polymerase sigma factor (sigma-70 family)